LLFSSLVLAHYRYFILNARYGELGGIPLRYAPEEARVRDAEGSERPGTEASEEARREYEQALGTFVESEGNVESAYWCVFAPSGIALTRNARGGVLEFLRLREPPMRLHRESDWLTNAYADITLLLHHCDTVAAKVAKVLRGTAKRIALEWVFSEQRFLLAAAEERSRLRLAAANGAGRGSGNGAGTDTEEGSRGGREGGSDGESGRRSRPSSRSARLTAAFTTPATPGMEIVEHAQSELLEIEKYYDRAANKAGRITYFWGMVAGVVAALGLVALAALVVHESFFSVDVDVSNVRDFFVCFAAGALGAVVSVLTRMRREDGFELDYEAGRWQAFALGSFRPFIGAVFGLVIYFALQSDLLQIAVPDEDPTTGAPDASFYFLALLSFVAGFSERLTKVVLGGAERSIASALGGDDGKPSAGADPRAGRLELLVRLHADGKLTDEEFEAAKRTLLLA
jgi:hypothetical protein